MLYDFSINLKIAENKNACLLFQWPKGSRSGENQDQEHANHFSTIRGLYTKKLIPQCKTVNTVLHWDRFWSVLLFSRNSWNCGVFAVVCQPRIHQKVHFFFMYTTHLTQYSNLSPHTNMNLCESETLKCKKTHYQQSMAKMTVWTDETRRAGVL